MQISKLCLCTLCFVFVFFSLTCHGYIHNIHRRKEDQDEYSTFSQPFGSGRSSIGIYHIHTLQLARFFHVEEGLSQSMTSTIIVNI